jgi:hypothetical protein
LARAGGGRIPDPTFFVIGLYADRNPGHARSWDRLMEKWRIVGAMHLDRLMDSFSALTIVSTIKCGENGNC